MNGLKNHKLKGLMCFGRRFEVKSGSGEKYATLKKVVKSFICLRNGNSDDERSLSLNKNVLPTERVHLDEEAVMGIRRMKDYLNFKNGIHNVSNQ